MKEKLLERAALFTVFLVSFTLAYLITSARPIERASRSVVEVYVSTEEDEGLQLAGSGSAVVIDDHHALTCWHVVHAADQVTLAWEGQYAIATVIGHDAELDLAVLEVKCVLGDPVRWGHSDRLHVADEVYAIGYPFDVTRLVRRGVVASINYDIEDSSFLVTDAAVNPGDSGGGLFDQSGKLVGISARIQTAQGLCANIGLAYIIPGDVAHTFVLKTLSKKAP